MKKLLLLLAAIPFMVCGCEKESGNDTDNDNGLFSGTMTVVYRGETVPSEKVEIGVDYEADGTLTLMFYQVKFVPQMPVSLDVKVSGITYIDKDGVVTFSGNDIVPTYGLVNTEMPDYTVTNLAGTISGGILRFSLNFGAIPTSYTGAMLIPE
ncbi:MAG: calycin-like domain-containing protein [Candidatus Cryptobacteroides sp.]